MKKHEIDGLSVYEINPEDIDSMAEAMASVLLDKEEPPAPEPMNPVPEGLTTFLATDDPAFDRYIRADHPGMVWDLQAIERQVIDINIILLSHTADVLEAGDLASAGRLITIGEHFGALVKALGLLPSPAQYPRLIAAMRRIADVPGFGELHQPANDLAAEWPAVARQRGFNVDQAKDK